MKPDQTPTTADISLVMRHIRARATPQSQARPLTARKAALASWSPEARKKRLAARQRTANTRLGQTPTEES